MTAKPCPECGAPRLPFKACQQCGYSYLAQLAKEKPHHPSPATSKEATAPNYGSGHLGRNRIGRQHRYDVQTADSEIQLYPGAFTDEPLYVDLNDLPWSSLTSPADELVFSVDDPAPISSPPVSSTIGSQLASLWLEEKSVPQMPMKWMREHLLFDGWPCPETTNFARAYVQDHPAVTLQHLQQEILDQVSRSMLPHPHLWRIRVGISRLKNVVRDMQGLRYVSVNGVYRRAYSIRPLGGLVGAQSFTNPHEGVVPASGYFVCWENEQQARDYNQKRAVEEFPFKNWKSRKMIPIPEYLGPIR